MSLTLQRLIWQVSPDVLNSTETLVLLRLADFAQEDGSSIYPSLKRVSQDTKLTERGIQKALLALLGKGILLLVKPFTSRTPNVYKIDVDYLKSLNNTHPPLDESCTAQGRMTFVPRDELDSPLTIEKTGRGEPCSPQGRTTFTSRDERRSPNPLYKPLIEPLILLPVSADGHGEEQDKQIRKKQQPIKEPKSRERLVLEQFNQWYECYPRKVSRKKALAAFTQILKQLSFDKLLALTRKYAQEVENRDQQYIPYPATWLRGERWEEVEGIPLQEEESITLPSQVQQNSAIDGRLQAFLDRYVHQVCNNAFAFKECQLQEEEDRIILQASSPFYRDRVELFERELKKHFGKQVLITLSDPKPPMTAPGSTSSLTEADFVEPQLQAFLANNPRIDASMYFAFKGTALQETETTVTLFNASAFCLSKLDFYLRELGQFFGKQVSLVCGEKPLRVKPKLEVLESSPKATQKKVSRVSTTSPSYGGHNLKKVAAA